MMVDEMLLNLLCVFLEFHVLGSSIYKFYKSQTAPGGPTRSRRFGETLGRANTESAGMVGRTMNV
jgi:hypothetical protein